MLPHSYLGYLHLLSSLDQSNRARFYVVFQARLFIVPKRWIGFGLRLARGAARCHSDRHSHPPSPGQSVFTRPPTDCLAIVYPGRALYPSGDGETQCLKVRSMNLQACLYVLPSRWARLLPTARLDEHRLTENTISSVCAFGEQRKHLAHSFYPSKLPSLSSGDEG
jgi:hypothetical protein